MVTSDEIAEAIQTLRSFRTDVSEIEAKKAASSLPKGLWKTVSAFANTAGGLILLGVDEEDEFAVSGVADPKKLADAVGTLCSEQMEPTLRPSIAFHKVDDKDIVSVEIPEVATNQKPCFFEAVGMNNGSYVRVGDSDRRLTAYEVEVMLSSRGQPREDEEPVPGTDAGDLDNESVQAFLARLRETRPAFGSLDDDSILRRVKVLVPDDAGSEHVLSLGGLLALGEAPQDRFPQLDITFVAYPTESGEPLQSGERFLDNATVEGPIPVMVRDVLVAIRRNMKRRATISGPGRADRWEYPEAALREAVVNALVHRDLSPSARGTQVQVEMYPDRLLIRNPGGLYGPVTLERLGEEGVSSSRNASLLKILEDVPLPGGAGTVCENRGSGIRTMIYALRAAGMSVPKFQDTVAGFSVEFPNHALLDDDTVEWIRALNEDGLSESQVTALAMLWRGDVLDNQTYRNVTGVDSRVATSELQDLVGRELVDQTGVRRWAKYGLSDRARGAGRIRRQGERLSPADRRVEVLDALGDETLSRADLARRTGLSDQTVRRWLKILRQEGRVELTTATQSRHAKYRRIGPPLGQLTLSDSLNEHESH